MWEFFAVSVFFCNMYAMCVMSSVLLLQGMDVTRQEHEQMREI